MVSLSIQYAEHLSCKVEHVIFLDSVCCVASLDHPDIISITTSRSSYLLTWREMRHLLALAAVKPPELIDQPYWSANEFVNKPWLGAKLMCFGDVNPVTWVYLG